MALADIQRVQIIAHAGIKMDVLASIQEEGIIQLEETSCDQHQLTSSSPDTSDLEHTLYRINRALSIFSQWEEKGFMKKLLSQKPQLEIHKQDEILQFDYYSLLTELEKLEEEKATLEAEIKFYEREIAEGDFIDIGEPIIGDPVYPVVVKSLVFESFGP